MFNNDFSRETEFKFFSPPLDKLWLGDRKHKSDKNPERIQPKHYFPVESLGEDV